MKIYAIYKGETFLCEGTTDECARYMNVKRKTIWFLNSPAYKKRTAGKTKYGTERNCIISICIGDTKIDNN